MIYKGEAEAFLAIEELNAVEKGCLLDDLPGALAVLWFKKSGSSLTIDGSNYTFEEDEMIALTEYHRIDKADITEARLIKFNRAFYCIFDHDSEVGCKGLLFFGSNRLPRIDLKSGDSSVFETVYRMFRHEFSEADHLQLEMLQMMLKRFLILTARKYKDQAGMSNLDSYQNDLIRNYNYLVEKHFREKHTVAEYADLLHKSAKTLANSFAKVSNKTPLQVIQDRRMLEARRLLLQADKAVQDVAYQLGFEDVQSFSRFFKRMEGLSPTDFIKSQGKN